MSKPRFEEEAFARMLQGAEAPAGLEARRMARLVAALERNRTQTSAPPFASALRERIVVEAERAARIPLRDRLAIAWRARNESLRRSFRVVTATGLAAMLMIGSGAALASSRNSYPGQWNYPLKRAQEGARLAVTRGPIQRGFLQLEMARTRLGEVDRLVREGVSDEGLIIDTLNEMDTSTVAGAELLIDASRSGAGIQPLRHLAAFTVAQRSRMEALVDRVPAGARPTARSSVDVLVRLGERVDAVIAGCPCPSNPLEIPAGGVLSLPGQPQPQPCACARPNRRGSDDNEPFAGGPSPAPTTPSPSPSGSGSPKPTTDLVPGTDAEKPVNDSVDQVNEILEDLGLPTIPPSPAPSLPGL